MAPDASRTLASRIASLDVEKDCREITLLLATWEFAWDIERALEFALFRTYAVPAISGLLARTGEFERRPRKRYDDTELILAEIQENGFDSNRGRRALKRLNEMHGRFKIADGDMLYVLSTFVMEPIRWLDRYGRRPMTPHEQRAWCNYYRRLGEHMGIPDIPGDLETFRRFNEAYETGNFRFAEPNKAVATATSDLLLGFYLPRWLLWAGRPAVRAFMDTPLLAAMGFPPAPRWPRRALLTALAIRARALRILPARRRPRLLTQVRRPTYPEGYAIEELGTFGRAGRTNRKCV
ncbi:MAG: DUF2236 domain-containing protein [Bauldia sp.]|uniref:oxygenase MpaB family protein n=1 Tax=Bauldia sp. TaxID=2575872 RepID=UPI001D40C55A|nr:oxygenase MpaB family protein [Bauldia sp.]MCB1495299.1 DUF2236 domain-containing protein [Bauldia sp.]